VDAKFAGVDAKFAGVDAKFDGMNARFDAVHARFDAKFDDVYRRIDRLAEALGSAKVWALVLYIAFAASMLGTMARGFGWL
jgi:hypothetical protein